MSLDFDFDLYVGGAFISTNDLHALLEEASDEKQAFEDSIEESTCELEKADRTKELALWLETHDDEYEELKELCGQIPTDETLIRDDEIEDYLDQLVNDCYDLPKDLPSFITLTIDYDVLKQDYTSIEYGADTYWVRCV